MEEIMKVVDGNFGQKDDVRKPMDILKEQMERKELTDLEDGTYLLLVDTGESLMMVSNLFEPADVVFLIEKSKMALLAQEFGGFGI